FSVFSLYPFYIFSGARVNFDTCFVLNKQRNINDTTRLKRGAL
ncbi:hypothetical protein GBAR_LOCUS6629, partial [Geodia barretti]